MEIRITKWLLYCGGIKCNWKLILASCVSLVTYRVKSGFDAVGMCSWVCVSDWFREQDVKNYRRCLAAIFIYIQCAQHCCNTECVVLRTHRYRPSQYNLLCTFSVHNIAVTHNVLLSEQPFTGRQGTICYVRSVRTTLNVRKMCCCQNTTLQAVKVQFVMYVQCAQH